MHKSAQLEPETWNLTEEDMEYGIQDENDPNSYWDPDYYLEPYNEDDQEEPLASRVIFCCCGRNSVGA